VWALGVTLYEALTGTRPFDGPDAATIAGAVQREVPIPPSQRVAGVPFVLDGVVLRLLSRDPATRIADAATARAELARAAAGIAAPATVANPVAAGATRAMPPVATGAAPPVAAIVDDGMGGGSSRRWVVPTVIALLVVVGALVAFALVSSGGGGAGERVTVPAVVGLRRQEALTRLENAGLSVTEVTEPNEDFGVDIVFAQAPAAGKRVGEDSVVVIKVSAGPTTTTSTSTTSTSTTSTSTTTSSTTTSSTTSTTTTTTVAPSSTTAP
jgi:serine/threonine-protein kinase